MNPIVEENLISFKVLEKKIFAYVCEYGRETAHVFLLDQAMQTALRKAFKRAFVG